MLTLPRIGKWIGAEESPRKFGKKTRVFRIYNFQDQVTLGWVKWFGRWRQYAFFPEAELVFEKQCLSDVTEFLKELMEERKQQRERLKWIAARREEIATREGEVNG